MLVQFLHLLHLNPSYSCIPSIHNLDLCDYKTTKTKNKMPDFLLDALDSDHLSPDLDTDPEQDEDILVLRHSPGTHAVALDCRKMWALLGISGSLLPPRFSLNRS